MAVAGGHAEQGRGLMTHGLFGAKLGLVPLEVLSPEMASLWAVSSLACGHQREPHAHPRK